ncbi:MAG TPA: cytochrome c [Thermoanaerobaculia bacterium]|jgi:mono/diheme cytochrome c family protein|nr:cytochrome c [Thermoanaerobaculia bacterium]
MRRLATAAVTLLVALLLGGAILVTLAYAGLVPVAAGQHHLGLVEWYLETAADRAVDRGGDRVQAPPDVNSPEMLRLGLVHYQTICVTCHGAPGVKPSDIGAGLYPDPPRLARRKRARIGPTYWIVKNGIRDSGMPAFGKTQDERELWAIAAFTVAMPHLSAAEYAQRAKEAGVPTPVSEEMEHAEHGAERILGLDFEKGRHDGQGSAPVAAPSYLPAPSPAASHPPHGTG